MRPALWEFPTPCKITASAACSRVAAPVCRCSYRPCHPRVDQPTEGHDGARPRPSSFRNLWMACALACTTQLWAALAVDAKEYVWRPRRHHRGIDEKRRDAQMLLSPFPTEHRSTHSAGSGHSSPDRGLWDSFTSVAVGTKNQIGRALQPQHRDWQDEPTTIRHATPLPSPSAQALAAIQSTTGLLALAAAFVGLALVVFRDKIRWRWPGQQRPAGRWIRDRSLGGKMVFIPDGELPAAPRRKSLWDDTGAAAPSPAPSAAAPRRATVSSPPQAQLPVWWDSAPRVPASQAFQDAASAKARSMLRDLETAKLGGQDYPLPALAELRLVCTEAGISVKARTDSGRDAMFKTAMEAAVKAASEGIDSSLFSVPSRRFVTSFATALGVPDDKAVSMAHGIVAARLQALLIELCLAMREGKSGNELFLLLGLASLQATFPLPAQSAEAEMVASRIEQRATLEERKEILLEYFHMDPGTADRVAELLAFDPVLVLPTLKSQGQQKQPTAPTP